MAVMLSAQCTDKRVNLVTPALFAAFPTPEVLAAATAEEVLTYIKSVSYPNSKAQHLVGMAKQLVERYDSQVPDNINDLQTLPGVGRKTANVVCAVIYNQPTMAVDTHIFRVSERIGLTTDSKNPLQTERQLVKYIPKNLSPRHTTGSCCTDATPVARKPKCNSCGIQSYCRYYQTHPLD